MSWSGPGRTAVAITCLLIGLTGSAINPAGAQPTGVDNRALVDADATKEVLDRAKTISQDLFTYSYDKLDVHKSKFDSLATGDFADEYEELFGKIEAQVVAQKVTVSSKISEAAVRTLTRSDAEVLVFLDMTSTRGDTGAESKSGAMFLASLRQADGEWKMSEIDLFEGK